VKNTFEMKVFPVFLTRFVRYADTKERMEIICRPTPSSFFHRQMEMTGQLHDLRPEKGYLEDAWTPEPVCGRYRREKSL
jgi:hypothetical protein